MAVIAAGPSSLEERSDLVEWNSAADTARRQRLREERGAEQRGTAVKLDLGKGGSLLSLLLTPNQSVLLTRVKLNHDGFFCFSTVERHGLIPCPIASWPTRPSAEASASTTAGHIWYLQRRPGPHEVQHDRV